MQLIRMNKFKKFIHNSRVYTHEKGAFKCQDDLAKMLVDGGKATKATDDDIVESYKLLPVDDYKHPDRTGDEATKAPDNKSIFGLRTSTKDDKEVKG